MTTAIIVAAGKSERMGAGTDKAFLSLVDKPVVAWTLLAFERCAEIDRIVLVVRKDQQQAAKAVARMFGIAKLSAVVPGGNRRQDSVQAGLAACDLDTRLVVVHDGARPLIASDVIADLVRLARRAGAATVGRRAVDTVKRVERGTTVSGTEARARLWCVQTPQAFAARTLREAYRALDPKTEVCDDCEAVERAGGKVKILETCKPNLKITTVEDLQLASAFLK